MPEATALQRITLEPTPPAVQTPHADARLLGALSEYFAQGRWTFMIDLAEPNITNFIQHLPHPVLSNSEVVAFYFGSQAYKALGQSDKHAACLKLLYSLEPFRHAIAGDYRQYIDAGGEEFLALEKEVGEAHLNGLELTGLFRKEEKAGCFIATACYGSYDCPEVLVLRRFRDDVLLPAKVGKLLVRLYYAVSPQAARVIARGSARRAWTQRLLIGPFVWAVRLLLRSGEEKKRRTTMPSKSIRSTGVLGLPKRLEGKLYDDGAIWKVDGLGLPSRMIAKIEKDGTICEVDAFGKPVLSWQGIEIDSDCSDSG